MNALHQLACYGGFSFSTHTHFHIQHSNILYILYNTQKLSRSKPTRETNNDKSVKNHIRPELENYRIWTVASNDKHCIYNGCHLCFPWRFEHMSVTRIGFPRMSRCYFLIPLILLQKGFHDNKDNIMKLV
jgi:hypothetical protein